MMENKPLSPEMANKVYDILVLQCGASETMRGAFIATETTELCSEWRFCGLLGYGGKFWNSNGKLYVSCYPEDETPERACMIGIANSKLAQLMKGMKGTKVTLQMPVEAAEKLLKGFREKDPVLLNMLEEFGVKEIMFHED